jgi:hypothetical protein
LKEARVVINSLKKGDMPGGVTSSEPLKNDLELMKILKLPIVREPSEQKRKSE